MYLFIYLCVLKKEDRGFNVVHRKHELNSSSGLYAQNPIRIDARAGEASLASSRTVNIDTPSCDFEN